MLSVSTKLAPLLALAFGLPRYAVAQSSIVSGSAPGFATGVTGGGNAEPVYPNTIEDLKSYLTSSEPQNIVISGSFDFGGSEGTQTHTACNTYECAPEDGGQAILNTLGACSGKSSYDVEIDTAAYTGIEVKSDKTLVGDGTGAILNGKGLRFTNGVSNIIIQNIAITNLNPKYVWGGDAISMSDCSQIWIDHVTTSKTGRQHYSFGQDSDKYITISNSFLNGETPYSTGCDNHTYWGFEMVGEGDTITLYRNYVYMTSGRSPAVSGTTTLHAVNNVFSNNNGHLIEGGDSGMGLFEGNVFTDITTTVTSGFSGELFNAKSTNLAKCSSALGRECVANEFNDATSFDYSDTGFFSNFADLTVVDASPVSDIFDAVTSSAGNTLAS
ncbi:polysaccharide lyase family 1 protein [Hortaea werneckii]|nr:polysaccharide lyase family 1 protein [Hortaea werneckii]